MILLDKACLYGVARSIMRHAHPQNPGEVVEETQQCLRDVVEKSLWNRVCKNTPCTCTAISP